MKKSFQLAVIGLICFSFSARAQVYRKKIVHSGESISDRSYYLFPSFADATVKLKTGGSLSSKMNFNLLICEMQFINPGNDTLVISNPENVDSILFSKDVFFFNKGYYEILASANSVKLAVLRKVSYEPIKIGALGLPDHSGTGIQSYTSVVTYTGEKKLVMNEDVEVTSETAYFLIADSAAFNKANKAAFIKAFPEKEEFIREYLKQNKTDFNKEADLEKLFQFCTTQN
ncbi:MAG TPA: hypothetical protein VFW07_14470 [Parafilimonas sp.]|nr:hypothetical protein [Parafilimonas sp.]